MNLGLLAAANSIHTVKIANGLVSLGHTVTLFSLPNHRDQDKALNPAVKLVYLKHGGGKGYILNSGHLKKAVREAGIQLLNAHFASGYGTLAMLSGIRPYVMSVWGNDVYEFPEKSFVHRWLIERNLTKASAILSTSAVMAKRASQYAPDRLITVTPFGIDSAAFTPVARADTDDSRITIGVVKIIAAKYGIRELILAFDALVKRMQNKDMRLSVYGDGPQRQELQRLAEQLGLAERVTFFGYIPHAVVPDALRTMDIFCVPSYKESFGVAAVEAMACGIPCVTSDADGFTEVMADGETGFIVPKGDVAAITDKLAVLAGDAEMRQRMGKAARQRVLDRYDWQDNLRTLADALTACGKRNE